MGLNNNNNNLETRMKEFYENRAKTYLTRRTPVAIRIDGKAFHTFTRGFQKPFDKIFMQSMQETMKYLCQNIQGCVFGYTQSDEITLILIDYKKFTSDAWFDYQVQKICSVAASMATMKFNQIFSQYAEKYRLLMDYDQGGRLIKEQVEQWNIYHRAITKGAMFDARCFNIPKEEVCNLIYWRQLDAICNSIQSVGQAYFSDNELYEKSCEDICNMLFTQKNINWNNFSTAEKRGAACIKVNEQVNIAGTMGEISNWEIDYEMPILKGKDRQYVNRFIYIGEESC